MAKEEQETTLLKLYQQFGDKTSMHGIGRVLTNNSSWKRVVWSVMFLLGLAFSVYQFVLTVNDYYSYPVTTEIILQTEILAKFPGVTICNLNSKRKSMIDSDLELKLATFGETEETPKDFILTRLLQANSDNALMHQISDMLSKCAFNRWECYPDNFTRIDTVSYGACYTFEITDPESEFISRPGPKNGLLLELTIEPDEYLPTTSKAGVMVIVHPTDEYPFPEDGGVLAPPGSMTSIKVNKGITHRLPAPYSTCVDESGHGSTQRNLFPNKKYMQKACIKSCFQLALYENCKCCDPDVPCDYYEIMNVNNNTTTNETDLKLPFCITFDVLKCAIDVEERFLRSELNCDERCPPSCDRTTFDTIVSSSLWPAKRYFNNLITGYSYGNKVVYNKLLSADNTSLERYIRSNFLRLEIFYDKLEFTESTAYAKYDWNLLLGTIGGLLGLWLGFSLLTAIEIVEVLVDTILFYAQRKHKEKSTTQTEQQLSNIIGDNTI